jgi:hypothetical protein
MRATIFTAALVALGLTVCPATAQRDRADSFAAAIAQAHILVPNGTLLLARPEKKPGTKVFGFYFFVDGQIVETEITFPRGDTFKLEPVSPAEAKKFGDQLLTAVKNNARAKLPMAQFVEIAKEFAKSNEVNGLAVVLTNNELVVQVTTGSGVVNISWTSGQVISGKN